MADITWSAYGLAMFTPEQRAAAAGVPFVPADNEPLIIRPPANPVVQSVGGPRVEGLNPNIPTELAEIHRRGWRFIGGTWLKNPILGAVVDPEANSNSPAGGRVGMASFTPQVFIPGGSVLGNTVPLAPAVLLPSFVGGRTGRVSLGEGLRPASGGEERVRFGRFAQVRGLSI